MAALMAATAFITIGCQNDTESRIAGIYEHPALPGQTFEISCRPHIYEYDWSRHHGLYHKNIPELGK